MTNREIDIRQQVAAVAVKWRNRARLSIDDAALLLGLSSSELEEIEAARASAPCDILHAMVNTYRVGDEDLAGLLNMTFVLHSQTTLSE